MAGQARSRAGDLHKPVTEGSQGDHFYADIAEVVHTHLNEKATMLVVEWWTPTHGLRSVERE
jgi:hypothetical protein